MTREQINNIIDTQRRFFATGATLPCSYRIDALRRLKDSIKRHESDILAALKSDLGKGPQESYMCEVGLTLSEISYMLSHVRRFAKEKTVMEYLPKGYKRLMPIGRLDKETEGLLLFTNDGYLAHRLLSPKRGIEKTYYAEHEGTVTQEDIDRFADGCILKDGTKCLPAVLEKLGEGKCLVRVREGKYHQVRRMMASLHKPVRYLRRISEGTLELKDLPLGMTRELTKEEIQQLESVIFDEKFF